jgi:putative DNA primase/helicase
LPRGFRSRLSRVFTSPGVKVDCALIFEGKQGIGKSSALRMLFDGDSRGWFTDEIAELGSKDAAMQMAGIWCIELAELDAMRRAEVSRLKAFLTRTNDRYRPPYGRIVVDVPRQCVFAGTVNDSEYLRDPTGGRRFWPVKCGTIDIRGLCQARDQLFAEAVSRYRRGEKWFLHEKELIEDATEEQSARQLQHPWEEPIGEWLAKHTNKANGVTVGEILENALYKHTEHWTDADSQAVGKCMRALGYEPKQKRVGTGRERRYYPPALTL